MVESTRTRGQPIEENASRAGFTRSLLRLPLFYKLIIANAAITLLAVVIAAAFIALGVRENPNVSTPSLLLPVALIAVAVSVVVNALVVHLALSPLHSLEETARAVQAGELGVRAPESPISDSGIERLVRTFNQMLDSVAGYRGRLREIAVRALDAAEKERLRLSLELHDDLAQSLAATLVQLKVARNAQGAAQAEQLNAIAGQLAGLIERVRGLANDLRPPALDMLGLGAALSKHARAVSESTGVAVTSQIDRIDDELTAEAELALYRLVQEALHNVVRHGDTQEARLAVKRINGRVEATVSDQGRGFAVAPTLAGGALGLIGMFERAAYVGGKVEVDSEPGRGTTVRIQIPVKGENV